MEFLEKSESKRYGTNLVIGLLFIAISSMLFWMDMHGVEDVNRNDLNGGTFQFRVYQIRDGHTPVHFIFYREANGLSHGK